MISKEKLSDIVMNLQNDLKKEQSVDLSIAFGYKMTKSEQMYYDAIKTMVMEEKYNDVNNVFAMVYSPYLAFHMMNTMLVDFCQEGNLPAFNFIIGMGAQVDYCNNLPMITACKHGNLNIVLALMEIGIKPPRDAICQAALNGQKEIITELIKVEMNINIDSGLPLRLCAENGLTDMVKFLIGCGADPHVLHDRALVVAVTNGHRDTVRLLLDNDADPCTLNDQCFTIAREKNYSEILEMLTSFKEGRNYYDPDETF